MLKPVLLACALLAAATPALAQRQVPAPYTSPSQVPAGAYAIDATHTTVQARVPHVGVSVSTFRFTGVTGTITLDPARPAASSVDVTVDARTIQTFSREFETELQGANFLNAAAHPNIRFVSRSATATSATHGRLTGELTFRGVARPATMDVEYVGGSPGFGGRPRVGFRGRMRINPVEFGLTAFQNAYVDHIELAIEVEAAKS